MALYTCKCEVCGQQAVTYNQQVGVCSNCWDMYNVAPRSLVDMIKDIDKMNKDIERAEMTILTLNSARN